MNRNIPFLLTLVHLLFLVLVGADPSPTPDPHPAVVSLPSRPLPASQRAFVTHQPQTAPAVEHDVLPFVLISTIDGALHAVERDTGKLRWSLRDGVEPLVGGAIRGGRVEEEYIVEPLSGALYAFEEEGLDSARLRRLPLTVEQLIELSPFTFPHSPSRIFTGSKHTSLLTLDLRTGQQIDCFSSSGDLSQSRIPNCVCGVDELDDLENQSRSTTDIIFIGRSDFRLTIHSSASSSSSLANAETSSTDGRRTSQEIMYSTYTPNSYDRPLAEHWLRMGREAAVDDDGLPVKRMRVELKEDGKAIGVEEGKGSKWATNLGSIGISVYDILLPLRPLTANPILVPQPPPSLDALFPKTANPTLDVSALPPTAYIGALSGSPALPPNSDIDSSEVWLSDEPAISLDDSSQPRPQLYALSSTAYPLINFANSPQPGASSNGTFRLVEQVPDKDQLLPYLLDPPMDIAQISSGADAELIPGPVFERPNPNTTWLWIVIGVLGFLTSLGVWFLRYARRTRRIGGEMVTPPGELDEKTPLLVEAVRDEKSVTFVEPKKSHTTPQAKRDSVALGGDLMSPDSPVSKKKPSRRRVRGRKKRPNDSNDGKSDDEEEEDDKGEGTSTGPGTTDGDSFERPEKPLPDLPRTVSSTALDDAEDKERLAISDTIIGYGSGGTVVLKGTWGDRPVAVKRILSDFTRLASQEVKLLQASDDHPNVIRYYCQEKRDNFLYIALDLCQASLADLIQSPDKHLELASALDRKRALKQVTSGLKHLHAMKIIHRDIKPQNVLVSRAKDGSLRMLVSDFGLARRLEQDQSSFNPTTHLHAGSVGWRAPECICGNVRLHEDFDQDPSGSSEGKDSSDDITSAQRHRLTKAVDLFALGCLYFWLIMSGEHPFGETYDRESNIMKGDMVNLDRLDIHGEEGVEAKELILRMLSSDPALRPETAECMIHPFFWTPAKRLAFLCDASDRFEVMELDPPEATLVDLEANASSVVGRDWYTRADKVFTNNLGKYRKYKGNSVRDLLRAMRNKKHHYQDLDPAAQRHFGPLPTGFLHYFTSRYPQLFIHVHRVIKDGRLRREPMFEGYFHDS